MIRFTLLRVFAGMLALACGPSWAEVTTAETWPQWRGPNRDGIVGKSTAWPDQLSGEALKQLWRIPLGPSYSGPIVSPSLVFTTETVDRKVERVRAVDRRTGELVWDAQWEGALSVPFFAKANGDWIRSTPTYDGECLYVAGMRDVLVCLDGDTGVERWRYDFAEELEAALPAFGCVCSPLVAGPHVYIQAGAGLCKLDKNTGELLWRKLVDGGGMWGSAFSSPVLAEIAGRKQLLVQTRTKLAGVDPETGEELWSREIPAFRGMNILTPAVLDDLVFTSSYGGKSLLFKINSEDGAFAAEDVWENKASGYMSSPVVIDGHIYMHLKNQRFTCIDAQSGESRWTTSPFGKYWSLVANGDRILALDERGELLLLQADPAEFKQLDSRTISDDPTWAHLAVCGDELFIREQNALAAYRWQARLDESASSSGR